MDKPLTLPLPALVAESTIRRQAFRFVAAQIALWWSRARERRALARLDERQLRDIGITRLEARREAEKPFWQP